LRIGNFLPFRQEKSENERPNNTPANISAPTWAAHPEDNRADDSSENEDNGVSESVETK
jgi:hypothetical protein